MGRYKSIVLEASIKDVITDGQQDLEELKDEMCEWRDNMDGTPAENTPKFEIVTETADAMENMETVDVDTLPEDRGILEAKVTFSNQKVTSGRQKTPSRAYRCSNACAGLEAAAEFLEEVTLEATAEEIQEDCHQMATELREIISTVEGLEFPGMYG